MKIVRAVNRWRTRRHQERVLSAAYLIALGVRDGKWKG